MTSKCPFCKKELETVHNINKRHGSTEIDYESWCRNCGASWVPECPDCGKPTWMNLKKEYVHP